MHARNNTAITERDRHTYLVETLRRADDFYYNQDETGIEISDAEYDLLYEEVQQLENASPHLKKGSVTQKPGGYAAVNSFESVRHSIPMLSLKKATTQDEIKSFLSSFPMATEWVVQPKVDGASLSLEYKNGKLVRALSRGDGEIGEDITANASRIKNIPHTISEDDTFDGVIRGEVVIFQDDFNIINKGPETFANARNAAAGALRSKSVVDVTNRRLKFLVYDATFDNALLSSRDALACLVNLGFEVVATNYFKSSGVWDAVQSRILDAANLPYETDGVVVKASSYSARRKAGNTSHHPKWAIAFKVAGETAPTRLREVTWQVGKTGIVCPVGELDPVWLSGTTISRVTLHNLSIVESLGCKIGDTVTIIRAGAVIPRVLGVEKSSPDSKKIVPPRRCPSCDSRVVEDGPSRVLKCTNLTSCPAQNVGKLVHWCSRKSADINAIGERWVEEFVEMGLLKTFADFYRLPNHESRIMRMDRMGQTQFDRFVESIEGSKNIGMRKALVGFSISMCSEGTAKRLCKYFSSVEEVGRASLMKLQNVPDIGEIVAKNIHTFLRENVDLINDLRALGVNLDRLPDDSPVEGKQTLTGLLVAITGSLSVSRAQFTAMIEKNGGKVSSSISLNTSYLITDDPDGSSSKSVKARSLGVTTITEKDFVRKHGL